MANLDLTGIITRICTDLKAKFSKVAVSRSLMSGTKCATVTVDGTDYSLYAPTPPTASITNPSMDGTASYGSGTSYARSNHVHPTDTSRAASTHDHGSITSAGAITSDTAVESGDKLVIVDANDANKLKRSGIEFGSDTTTFLRNDGQWAAAGGGGGSASGLLVTITYNGSTYTADKTMQEIKDAIDAGITPMFAYPDETISGTISYGPLALARFASSLRSITVNGFSHSLSAGSMSDYPSYIIISGGGGND